MYICVHSVIFVCVCEKGHHLDTWPDHQPNDVSGMDSFGCFAGKHVFVIFYMIIRSESGKHCGRYCVCVCVYDVFWMDEG